MPPISVIWSLLDCDLNIHKGLPWRTCVPQQITVYDDKCNITYEYIYRKYNGPFAFYYIYIDYVVDLFNMVSRTSLVDVNNQCETMLV